jgi:hypothetical protein
MSYTQSHPNLGPSSRKNQIQGTKSLVQPSFSEATRNDSQNGKEVMRPG